MGQKDDQIPDHRNGGAEATIVKYQESQGSTTVARGKLCTPVPSLNMKQQCSKCTEQLVCTVYARGAVEFSDVHDSDNDSIERETVPNENGTSVEFFLLCMTTTEERSERASYSLLCAGSSRRPRGVSDPLTDVVRERPMFDKIDSSTWNDVISNNIPLCLNTAALVSMEEEEEEEESMLPYQGTIAMTDSSTSHVRPPFTVQSSAQSRVHDSTRLGTQFNVHSSTQSRNHDIREIPVKYSNDICDDYRDGEDFASTYLLNLWYELRHIYSDVRQRLMALPESGQKSLLNHRCPAMCPGRHTVWRFCLLERSRSRILPPLVPSELTEADTAPIMVTQLAEVDVLPIALCNEIDVNSSDGNTLSI
ncbi:hypothetical protein B0H11DRAFT_1907594 [Mycena galericulata]|nr:hypothetical protein B0H11DRAFT_1907594 [Mycena galericulata]